MKNNTLSRFLVVLAVILFAACTDTKDRPNIIFILADDLGYGDVGFNGGNKIYTPALDQMAKDGVVFTRHYSGSTVCGPSRASLMTGKHTGWSSVRENPRWTASGKPADLLPEDVTVAEELKRAGYQTGIVGKWGLGENLKDGVPNKQGFDYFYGFNKHRTAHHYYPETVFENENLLTLEGNDTMNKKGQHIHYKFVEKALDFIEDNSSKPFFLYLAFTIPHYELTIPEHEKEPYYKKDWPLRKMKMGHYRNDENGHVTYAAMVSRMDKDIAIIREKLSDLGIDDNTLIIFTSDNGHEYDALNNEFFNSNGDFRGKKRDLYEGGIRMPFVAVWPEKIQSGTTSDHISAFWDFLPTACEVAGVKPTDEINGISYLPSLLGKENKQKEHDFLYWEFNERKGPMQAVIQNDWKLVNIHSSGLELYNLKEDIGEENNLAEKYPEKLQELKKRMDNARIEHPEFPLVKKEFKKK